MFFINFSNVESVLTVVTREDVAPGVNWQMMLQRFVFHECFVTEFAMKFKPCVTSHVNLIVRLFVESLSADSAVMPILSGVELVMSRKATFIREGLITDVAQELPFFLFPASIHLLPSLVCLCLDEPNLLLENIPTFSKSRCYQNLSDFICFKLNLLYYCRSVLIIWQILMF